ncbi:MAG: pro-sigmaK processing inhibitor BofA family protein [Clostridiales bacterium]|jgi:pro-sigmaK processing inhibitor BofA|nr:pro-sigmaK processing inhibitor BofA family protein [Clostridiales bacterium]
MVYLEIAVSFIVGLLLVLLLAWVFSIKSKGLAPILINAAAGIAVLILLNVFRVAALPLNPLSALLTGLLGVPGLAAVYILTAFF